MEIKMEEIAELQSYLEITTTSNPMEIQERLSELMVYLARSSELLAVARKELRKKKSSEISQTIIAVAKETNLSSKVQNQLLDCIAEEEAFLVDWLDRINSTIVHQIDGLRSLLSYAKEEMRMANNVG